MQTGGLMKKLTRSQYTLVHMSLFMLIALPCLHFLQDYFPDGGWLEYICFLSVIILTSFLCQLLLSRFAELPDKNQPAVPLGWRGILCIYALFLFSHWFWYRESGDNLLNSFIFALIVTVIVVLLDRLTCNYQNFTRAKQKADNP